MDKLPDVTAKAQDDYFIGTLTQNMQTSTGLLKCKQCTKD